MTVTKTFRRNQFHSHLFENIWFWFWICFFFLFFVFISNLIFFFCIRIQIWIWICICICTWWFLFLFLCLGFRSRSRVFFQAVVSAPKNWRVWKIVHRTKTVAREHEFLIESLQLWHQRQTVHKVKATFVANGPIQWMSSETNLASKRKPKMIK